MRKLSLAALLLTTATIAACGGGAANDGSNTAQALGPDGTEFVSATVANAKCRSVVLRGTQQFKNRAFVMPQAYIAVDNNQQTIFQTITNPGGGYTLRVGVYFPGAGTVDGPRPDSANIYEPDCTYDEIKTGLNANLADADKVNYPEPLLVNYITASLQGISGKAMVGTAGTDVLSYAGKTAILEFPIPDQASLASVVDRLRRGTQLNFDMTFSARASDGFVSVDVDLSQVSTSLAASLGNSTNGSGSIMGVGVAFASSEEFKMKIAQILNTMNINIAIVGSKDETFNKLAQSIIDKMIIANPAVAVQAAALPAGVTPPVPPGGGATTPAAPTSVSPLSVGVSINIQAAVESLKAMGHYTATASRDSADLNQHTYTTWAIVQANYTDPGTEDSLSYSNADGAVFSQSVKKGMTVALLPLARATSTLTYSTQPTYFNTKAELMAPENNMQGRFQMLADYPNSIKESAGSPAFMYEDSGWQVWSYVSNWSYFNWGYETSITTTSTPVMARFTDADFADYMANIKVEFNTSGRLYSLADLAAAKLSKGDIVDGTLDRANQRVVISPGADIGRMKIFNGDVFATDQQVYDKHYFQRHMGGYGRGQVDIQYSNVEQPTAKASQRSVLYVRLIADQGTTGTISASGIQVTGGDGALHPPPAAAAPPPPP